jgi:hypothetical protein
MPPPPPTLLVLPACAEPPVVVPPVAMAQQGPAHINYHSRRRRAVAWPFLSLAVGAGVLAAAAVPWGARADVPPAQLAALEDLYNATGGPHWYDSTNWLMGDPCVGQWVFVTCDAANTTVVDINLAGNTLNGTLPASISALTALTYANMRAAYSPLPRHPPPPVLGWCMLLV